ncbi:MAG: type I phosphomannose isomerase catalytic subunit [Breznakia sp.]
MYPLKLKPIYDKTIWGGHRLSDIRKNKLDGYGTSWEVSAHPYCQNEIQIGKYQGMTIQAILEKHSKEMLGLVPKEKMLRLAYLDTKDDLSIQVHPYTRYAKEHENDYGKTESWYVLEADTNAKLVAGTLITDKGAIKKAIEDESLEQYLQYHDIKAGDFIHINAGMLHALGGGILAIEIGTNSNTTYRFYDYGRKDVDGNGRELHLKKSFDVVDLSLSAEVVHTPITKNKQTNIKTLVECDDYVVEVIDIVGNVTLETNQHFECIAFVYGDGKVCYQKQEIENKYTDTLFIPAACEEYTIYGNCRIIRSYAR